MIKVKHKIRHTMPSIQEALIPLGDLVSGIHEACDSVAPIRQMDFDLMVDLTIREKGLLEPIRVDAERRLVDGRSRIMACFAAGITITSDDIVETDADPWTIATSNAARRHLTLDQRVMAATTLLNAEKEKAAERKRAGAEKGRAARNIPLATESVVSGDGKKRRPTSCDIVAKQAGVPRDKLTTAARVRKADPQTAAKVESGKLSLAEAAEQVGVAVVARPRKCSKPSKRSASKRRKCQPVAERARIEVMVFSDDITSISRRCSTNGYFLHQLPGYQWFENLRMPTQSPCRRSVTLLVARGWRTSVSNDHGPTVGYPRRLLPRDTNSHHVESTTRGVFSRGSIPG